jgi:hypothetical protein
MTGHLSQEELLRHLDGEMSNPGMRKAREHLQACWSCQVEFGRLKEHIAAIFDAQATIVAPSLPPPPAPWPRLERRLDRATRSNSPPFWRKAISLGAGSVRAQLVLGAIVVALALVVFRVLDPVTTVSAKEVLARTSAADGGRLAIAGPRVVRQRVRVKRTLVAASSGETTRLESWKSVKSTYWKSAGNPVSTCLFDLYRQNGLASALPLSPPALQAWVKLAGAEPSASTSGENIEVHLSADASGREHGIEAISFQVQKRDWHVNQMTLSLADATFQITEEDSAIMDWREVPDDVQTQLEPAAAKSVRSVAIHSAPSGNLDDLEMAVRYGLHRIDADLGENIEIAARPPDSLAVNAWSASPERKEQLATLFAHKPGVQLDFQPPAAIHGAKKAVTPLQAAASPQSHDLSLEQFFHGQETMESYTRAILEAGDGVLAHFYALRDLAARWPAEKDDSLSAGAKAQLAAMVRDHARDIRAGVSGWEAQLGVLLKDFDQQLSDASGSGPSWRAASASGFEAARRADQILRSLLTTSDAPLTVGDALPRLQQSLRNLELAIRDLLAALS